MNPPAWMKHGACVDHPDPDAWFAHAKHEPERTQQAIDICNTCPVQAECGAYARTERIDHGIWGGLTVSDRRGRTRRRKPIEHGTYNGYRMHLRRAEIACGECLKANVEYQAHRNAERGEAPRYVKCAHQFGCEQWALRDGDLCWAHARGKHEVQT